MDDLKILVVDDDKTTCTLLETVLKMENYQTASSDQIENEDIIALLNNKRPDILILDYHLGDQDTIDFVPVIRADDNWQQLPILMTSAIDLQQECLAAGANGFILKPFDWQAVTQKVNAVRKDLIE